MKTLIIALALATGTAAQADGFRCITATGLKVTVYNQTDANEGTRNAAVMILSDSSIGIGNKTIASFKASKGVLTSSELRYVAKVDLRMVESNRKGELIAGTKLGYVDTVTLAVNFTYAQPVRDGDTVRAAVIVLKRDGTSTTQRASCARYLKN